MEATYFFFHGYLANWDSRGRSVALDKGVDAGTGPSVLRDTMAMRGFFIGKVTEPLTCGTGWLGVRRK